MRTISTLSTGLFTLSFLLFAPLAHGVDCQTLLTGTGYYACTITNQAHTTYHDTFYFYSSTEFSLYPASIGTVLDCSCLAKGSTANPKFDVDKQFLCAGNTPFGAEAFLGKVNRDGSKISKGQITTPFGYSFVYDCVKQ